MSTVELSGDTLAIHLTPLERAGGLLKDLRIPVTAIVSAAAVPDGLRAARGLRAPGLAIPGRVKVGTWRGRNARSYVAVRPGPALRLRLAGLTYDTVVVSTPNAVHLASQLQALVEQSAQADAAREVTFTSGALTLAGTLTYPAGPVRGSVLLIGGSGPLDRDGNHPRLRLDIQAQLARALDAAGYATLRYDRRGVGASDGDFMAAGLRHNIDDATAALATLHAHTGVTPDRTFLLGHSEGALVAASVAATTATLGGVMLLSCPARPGEQTLVWQSEQIVPTLPGPVRHLLRILRVDPIAKVRANHAKIRATTTPVARVGGAKLNALWFREFMDYDPRPDLSRITAPVLAITGSKDLQTPPEDLTAISAAAAGPVQTALVDDVSHILRSQPGAATLRSYRRDTRRPIDTRVIEHVLTWLGQHVNDPAN
jgi:hypothetical protein